MPEVYMVLNLTAQQVDTMNELMMTNNVSLRDLKKVELAPNLPARLLFTFDVPDSTPQNAPPQGL